MSATLLAAFPEIIGATRDTVVYLTISGRGASAATLNGFQVLSQETEGSILACAR